MCASLASALLMQTNRGDVLCLGLGLETNKSRSLMTQKRCMPCETDV